MKTVEADTAEHAVVAVAVTRQTEGEVVYEAWPEGEPGSNLRMIIGRIDRQLTL